MFVPVFAHGFPQCSSFCFAHYLYSFLDASISSPTFFVDVISGTSCISYLRCVINLPKLMTENSNNHLLFLMISVDEVLRSGSVRWFWIRITHELEIRCWLRLQSSEDFSRVRRSTSKGTHSQSWQFDAGELVLLHVVLSMGLLESHCSMPAGFPKSEGCAGGVVVGTAALLGARDPRDQGWSRHTFSDLALKYSVSSTGQP